MDKSDVEQLLAEVDACAQNPEAELIVRKYEDSGEVWLVVLTTKGEQFKDMMEAAHLYHTACLRHGIDDHDCIDLMTQATEKLNEFSVVNGTKSVTFKLTVGGEKQGTDFPAGYKPRFN